MKLKNFINENAVYKKVENEIREWIETTYKGLSIDFYELTMEIVRTDPNIDYSAEQTQKITEVVNIKIGDILEAHAEEIYIRILPLRGKIFQIRSRGWKDRKIPNGALFVL